MFSYKTDLLSKCWDFDCWILWNWNSITDNIWYQKHLLGCRTASIINIGNSARKIWCYWKRLVCIEFCWLADKTHKLVKWNWCQVLMGHAIIFEMTQWRWLYYCPRWILKISWYPYLMNLQMNYLLARVFIVIHPGETNGDGGDQK